MHIDSTQVTIDRIEDPFKDFGPAIVRNIVSYSSSSEEEEIKSQVLVWFGLLSDKHT